MTQAVEPSRNQHVPARKDFIFLHGSIIPVTVVGRTLKSIETREWIRKNDYLPVKTDMKVSVEMNMDIVTIFYEYNGTITISLPPEAASARESNTGR